MATTEPIKFNKIYVENEELNRIQSDLEDVFIKINKNFNTSNNAESLSFVGDIKQTVLTEPQFLSLAGSDWALADGRDITDSTLAILTSTNTLPDLRGKFLRMADSTNSLLVAQTDTTAINGCSATTVVASQASISRLTNSTLTSATTTSAGTHTHSISITSNTGGSHTHSLVDHANVGYYNDFIGGVAGYLLKPTVHSHNGTFSNPHKTTTDNGHTHLISGTSASSGSHTHTVNGSATGGSWQNSGGSYTTNLSSSDVETRPINMPVNFFIKVN